MNGTTRALALNSAPELQLLDGDFGGFLGVVVTVLGTRARGWRLNSQLCCKLFLNVSFYF